eukprot:GHVS01064441.1.p1 GENE.GHVS01064441.1~~GHVS01064441.1.p1  ORF type:complete len:738 (-),score=63.99 GHVS01064441.1:200-2389(-)
MPPTPFRPPVSNKLPSYSQSPASLDFLQLCRAFRRLAVQQLLAPDGPRHRQGSPSSGPTSSSQQSAYPQAFWLDFLSPRVHHIYSYPSRKYDSFFQPFSITNALTSTVLFLLPFLPMDGSSSGGLSVAYTPQGYLSRHRSSVTAGTSTSIAGSAATSTTMSTSASTAVAVSTSFSNGPVTPSTTGTAIASAAPSPNGNSAVDPFQLDVMDTADTVEVAPELISTSTGSSAVGVATQNNWQNTDGRNKGSHEVIPRLNGNETAVPSGSFARLWNLGGLVIGLAAGTAVESARRIVTAASVEGPSAMSAANAERLSRTLCRMRGAALKLGQMLSIQEDYLPVVFKDALAQARNRADRMPAYQLEEVLSSELGQNWRSSFASFHDMPVAAASIGQVHFGILTDGRAVAVKVQYPGVGKSISSDVRNLLRVATLTGMVPPTMFLDRLCKEMEAELQAECDYRNEARFYVIFKELLKCPASKYSHHADMEYSVPRVVEELSGQSVLTTDWIEGMSLDQVAGQSPQRVRDRVGSALLSLCLREIFEFALMNTDPNPANFFYSQDTDRLTLVDFGASRSFGVSFVDNYMRLVYSAAHNDVNAVKAYSVELGFLNGTEEEVMVETHVSSVLTVGEPYRVDTYDFGNTTIMDEIYRMGPVMFKHRKVPPPTETYSLHRKLAGCYLLCAKLNARVKARQILFSLYSYYQFSTPDPVLRPIASFQEPIDPPADVAGAVVA